MDRQLHVHVNAVLEVDTHKYFLHVNKRGFPTSQPNYILRRELFFPNIIKETLQKGKEEWLYDALNFKRTLSL